MDLFIQYGIPILLGLWIGWLLTRKKTHQKTSNARHIISYETFKQNMRKGQLIDIRKKSQFEEDKIKGARHYTLGFLKHKNQRQVRKDNPVFLYCQTGSKSKRAAKTLTKKGFKSVYVLEGGFEVTKNKAGD